ncbi:uncharacterized protein Z520_02835 [Fonsecaea multimorphosa CBS 102226]|uniref:Class II aldolase/adducin N-terminal domain-containing protein n=1 Tax=Fonsecaea multimorphosa CBS 102226 TaxID=1442371 RepID=A0A0D2K635_9EURO|nr:uncharacterized protein Z520_02835 [Fonsecaea multimorphosa CBS 102226]KIY01283.1 hypothetical protein Z520_02835 [Fonsecaea multimorphosa CBS 102226]OAL28560.1 hypothetical protein AYO22_02754 [Fonsecaea multimorphosa]
MTTSTTTSTATLRLRQESNYGQPGLHEEAAMRGYPAPTNLDDPVARFNIPNDADPSLMTRFPRPPQFADTYEEREYLKGRLALAFRIFGRKGFDEGVAGHITLRDPVNPNTFWVNPFGLSFNKIKKSDLILVDEDGKVIGGGKRRLINTAAYMIHSAIHRARPDVLCAAHSHSLYGRAFCTLGRPIDIITQDSCVFYNDLAVYKQFGGIVFAKEEGENIAKALGNKKACLLQNHGLLTAGPSIEAVVFWFVSLEKCCQAQLLADAAAGGRGQETVKIDDEDAAYTAKNAGQNWPGWFSGLPLFDDVLDDVGDEVYQ